MWGMIDGMLSVQHAEEKIATKKGTSTYTDDWMSDYIRNDLSLMPAGCFARTFFHEEKKAGRVEKGTCPRCKKDGPAGQEHISCEHNSTGRLGSGSLFA